MNYVRPNPTFLRNVSSGARKAWAQELRKQHKAGVGQANSKMIYGNQNGTYKCCLMVLLDQLGTPNERNTTLPNVDSKMSEIFGDRDPYIIRLSQKSNDRKGEEVHSSTANDALRLTFPQIASLIYPDERNNPQDLVIEIDTYL